MCCKFISKHSITAARNLQETKWGDCEGGTGHVYCQNWYGPDFFDCNNRVFDNSGDELDCPKVKETTTPKVEETTTLKVEETTTMEVEHQTATLANLCEGASLAVFTDFGCH